MDLVYHIKCLMSRQFIYAENPMARIIDTEDKNLIGKNLKKIRTERKMSQQAL